MKIREARSGDAVQVSELLAHLGYPASPVDIPPRLATISAGGGTVLLASGPGGSPIGLVGLQALPVLHAAAPVAYITALVVAPEYRGRGVGRSLVEAAAEWARQAGCSRLTVTSGEHRADAHRFYPAAGLPYTGRRFSRPLPQP